MPDYRSFAKLKAVIIALSLHDQKKGNCADDALVACRTFPGVTQVWWSI